VLFHVPEKDKYKAQKMYDDLVAAHNQKKVRGHTLSRSLLFTFLLLCLSLLPACCCLHVAQEESATSCRLGWRCLRSQESWCEACRHVCVLALTAWFASLRAGGDEKVDEEEDGEFVKEEGVVLCCRLHAQLSLLHADRCRAELDSDDPRKPGSTWRPGLYSEEDWYKTYIIAGLPKMPAKLGPLQRREFS
jgi:hypothetical protein